MVTSFLMVGQSNMAGRGNVAEVKRIVHDGKLLMLRNCKWIGMREPINYDRHFSGVSLAASFAECVLEGLLPADEEAKVGLIPAADGGSSLHDWRIGGALYENAVFLTRMAMKNSTLAGIIWHQGEAECGGKRYETYEERFMEIMESMKRDIGCPDVPVIVGGLGDFLAQRTVSPDLVNYGYVNEALVGLCQRHEGYYYVSARGLTSNADFLHFNAVSLREFGKRYYVAYRDRRSVMDDEFADNLGIAVGAGADYADIMVELAELNEKFRKGEITEEQLSAERARLIAEM